jgi:hypothetical protein
MLRALVRFDAADVQTSVAGAIGPGRYRPPAVQPWSDITGRLKGFGEADHGATGAVTLERRSPRIAANANGGALRMITVLP